MIDKQTLLHAAQNARNVAYAPYSAFSVGAAILGDNDVIYTGCNIENAAYGETCCAERVALFKAVSDGVTAFKAIAVVGGKTGATADTPCTPCGSCRQVLAEFCDDSLPIIMAGSETTLGELLPRAFRLKG